MPEHPLNLIDTLDDAYNRAAVIEKFEALVGAEVESSKCHRKAAVETVVKRMPKALRSIIMRWLRSSSSPKG